MDDPVSEAARTVEDGMSVQIAHALGTFRDELAKYPSIDPDEAKDYGTDYLNHLLEAWLPIYGDEVE